MNRFDGVKLLEKLRGKKIMLVGDSLSNNQWQSLACMLHSVSELPHSNYTLQIKGPLSILSFPVSLTNYLFIIYIYILK